MNPKNIPFTVINWDSVTPTTHPGDESTALWQTLQFPELRMRIVAYSAGYSANHWCQKGHIVHCLEGEFITEQENGELFALTKGMTYVVTDDLSSHRSVTKTGVKLLIIDGDFLKYQPDDQLSLPDELYG